ncbi:MAG: hypothetical protein B6I24_09150 [Bacteroidetes bacterium 4572_128]|nr:MAG: hypothetical protein B6I24_09150 [Bacteroidetes bacterium 4572_128]
MQKKNISDLKTKIELLKNSDIFIKLEVNEIVFQKGEKGDAMYIIIDGELAVYDKNHIFTILKKKDTFGEYSLIDSSVRSASVRTLKKTHLLKLNQNIFLNILENNFKTTLNIFHSLIKRVKDKDLLEENLVKQKKEITDSINYASLIQKAVFSPKELIDKLLKSYFILYEPKDIVSGDFYWVNKKNNKIVVIAADCTGHGVPGAFMSMLGISFLNEIINKLENPKANEILNLLRKTVKKSLRQTGKYGEARDGIDMALCIIDFENLELEFAGANNPLILIRKDELLEVKPDKMPIGIHFREKESFTNNKLEIKKDDRIYLFSDGYYDQFGGKRGRKFLKKNFKKLLKSIYKKKMEEQKIILKNSLNNWKKNYEQIDDILVFGIEIN